MIRSGFRYLEFEMRNLVSFKLYTHEQLLGIEPGVEPRDLVGLFLRGWARVSASDGNTDDRSTHALPYVTLIAIRHDYTLNHGLYRILMYI